MKKVISFAGIAGLCLLLAYYSCSTPDARPSSIEGRWKLDSFTHPRDTARVAMASLLFALASDSGIIRYSFSADTLTVSGEGGVLERKAYTLSGDSLRLRDSVLESVAVSRVGDSILLLTGKDSLRVHLSRAGMR